MSKFDELKAAAELAMSSTSDFEYEQFQNTYGPAKFLELLAIQAQLVEALKLSLPDIEEEEEKQRVANKKGSRHVTKARIVRAALAAAGAQP